MHLLPPTLVSGLQTPLLPTLPATPCLLWMRDGTNQVSHPNSNPNPNLEESRSESRAQGKVT